MWVRGLSFFNLQFLKRMLYCGLLGLTLYFLLPLLAIISGKSSFSFWEVLKSNLMPQYDLLESICICLLHPLDHFAIEALFAGLSGADGHHGHSLEGSLRRSQSRWHGIDEFPVSPGRVPPFCPQSGWPLTRRSARGISAWGRRS